MSSATSGGDLAASWQGLAQLPSMLNDVRGGILAVRAMGSVPAAATATGTWTAGAAIWALGAEIAVFVAQTIQAIDDDIDGLTQTQQNYQRNEDELVAEAMRGIDSIDGLNQLLRPELNGGIQSCTARGVLTAAAALEEPARAGSAAVHTVGNASRSVLDGGRQVLDSAGNAAANVVDDVPYVGAWAGGFVRGVSDAGEAVLAGTSTVVRGMQDSVAGVTDGVAEWADGRERMADLQGSCAPAGGAR